MDSESPQVPPPKVSVIIPAFQTAAFIVDALESVFAQTFRDFEVIVVNDGSPDTEELETMIAPYRSQIIYIKQQNRGPAGARNSGIRQARGTYLAFLDSDDCWLPDYLASQLTVLEQRGSLDMVYADAEHFGDSSVIGKTFMQTCPSSGPVTLESLITEDCHVITSCTVVDTQVALDVGLFDEASDLRGCEDFDLWLRILKSGGQVAYQTKVIGRYRTRPGSLTQDQAKMSAALIAVYRKLEGMPDIPVDTRTIISNQLKQTQAHADLYAGRNFVVAGDFERGRRYLIKANSFLRRAKLKVAIIGLRIAPHWTRLAVLGWNKFLLGRQRFS